MRYIVDYQYMSVGEVLGSTSLVGMLFGAASGILLHVLRRVLGIYLLGIIDNTNFC